MSAFTMVNWGPEVGGFTTEEGAALLELLDRAGEDVGDELRALEHRARGLTRRLPPGQPGNQPTAQLDEHEIGRYLEVWFRVWQENRAARPEAYGASDADRASGRPRSAGGARRAAGSETSGTSC